MTMASVPASELWQVCQQLATAVAWSTRSQFGAIQQLPCAAEAFCGMPCWCGAVVYPQCLPPRQACAGHMGTAVHAPVVCGTSLCVPSQGGTAPQPNVVACGATFECDAELANVVSCNATSVAPEKPVSSAICVVDVPGKCGPAALQADVVSCSATSMSAGEPSDALAAHPVVVPTSPVVVDVVTLSAAVTPGGDPIADMPHGCVAAAPLVATSRDDFESALQEHRMLLESAGASVLASSATIPHARRPRGSSKACSTRRDGGARSARQRSCAGASQTSADPPLGAAPLLPAPSAPAGRGARSRPQKDSNGGGGSKTWGAASSADAAHIEHGSDECTSVYVRGVARVLQKRAEAGQGPLPVCQVEAEFRSLYLLPFVTTDASYVELFLRRWPEEFCVFMHGDVPMVRLPSTVEAPMDVASCNTTLHAAAPLKGAQRVTPGEACAGQGKDGAATSAVAAEPFVKNGPTAAETDMSLLCVGVLIVLVSEGRRFLPVSEFPAEFQRVCHMPFPVTATSDVEQLLRQWPSKLSVVARGKVRMVQLLGREADCAALRDA